ncbi:MAG: tetratricopeptide repeat protein [Anaerolineae bacterium]|nr:tetratricopeptide repeat protein [Anaerolineae bacterium]
MALYRLFLLGEMRLEQGGTSSPLRTKGEQRWIALLALLALERRKMDRRMLARFIWQYEEKPMDRLRRHTLEELKKKIPPELLKITPDSVHLITDNLWVDANIFADALDESGDLAQKSLPVDGALALYEGDFMEGFTFPEIGAFSEWQENKTTFLRDLFTKMISGKISESFRAGDLAGAEAYAARWVKRKPGDVQAHAWLLSIYEQQANVKARARHLRRTKTIFTKYGITPTDFRRAQAQVDSFASQLPGKPLLKKAPLKDIMMPDLDRGNPPFYQDYLDALFNLAARNPDQAIKYAGNISRILFDLMDHPQQVDQMLTEVERLILGGDHGVNLETKFRLTLQRLRIYRALSLTDKAVQLVNDFRDDAPPLLEIDHETRADWLRNRALIRCWIEGDYRSALDDFEQARVESVLAGKMDWEIGIVADMGLVHWNQGNYTLAEQLIRFSKQQYMLIGGHDLNMIRCTGNLGLVYLFQGKLELAFENVTRQLDLATSLSYIHETRRATGNRGIIRFHLGQYSDAIADLETSIQMVKAENEGYVNCLINLSRCYRAQKNQQLSHELARDALALAEVKGYHSVKIIAQRALAEILPHDQAVALLKETKNAAHERQRYFDEAACLLLLAEYTRDARSQNSYWKQASRILHTLGAQRWLEKSPFELPTL